jgi:hypothetical protein
MASPSCTDIAAPEIGNSQGRQRRISDRLETGGMISVLMEGCSSGNVQVLFISLFPGSVKRWVSMEMCASGSAGQRYIYFG